MRDGRFVAHASVAPAEATQRRLNAGLARAVEWCRESTAQRWYQLEPGSTRSAPIPDSLRCSIVSVCPADGSKHV